MWWKIYFWIYLIGNVINVFISLQFAPFGISDITGILLGIFLQLALYAYVFKKTVLQANYWKILFWIVVFFFVEEMLELFVLPKDFVANFAPFLKTNISLSAEERLFSWLISLPGVYAIYKLGQK